VNASFNDVCQLLKACCAYYHVRRFVQVMRRLW